MKVIKYVDDDGFIMYKENGFDMNKHRISYTTFVEEISYEDLCVNDAIGVKEKKNE